MSKRTDVVKMPHTPAMTVNIPVALRKDGSVKTLSMEFLYDLEQHYRAKGVAVLDYVLENHPLEYFKAIVGLSKVTRVEANVTHTDARKPQTVDEILQRVEAKVGPRGRELFEKYLTQVEPLVGEVDKS